MTGAINFSGLGSGLDTKSIVDALVNAQKVPINNLEKKKTTLNQHSEAYSGVKTKVTAIKTAAEALDTKKEFLSYTGTSSDDTVFKVATSGDAIPGKYEVTVSQLAKAEKNYSTTFADYDSTSIVNSGSYTLSITVGSDSYDVTVDNSTTLGVLASSINSTAGSSVTAGVVYNGSSYRLQISGNDTGTANAITLGYSDNALSTALGMTEQVAAQDCEFRVDSLAETFSSSTNTVASAFPGVTMTVLTTGTADITVAADSDSMATKVQEFLDKYNLMAYDVHNQLSYKGKSDPNSLQGDMTLRSVQSLFQKAIGGNVSGLSGDYQSLASIGITTGNKGNLDFDKTKFAAAVAADLDSVRKLFATDSDAGTTGKMDSIKTVCDNLTQLGDGLLAARQDGIGRSVRRIDKEISRLQMNLDSYRENLNQKFYAMEETMVKLKSQNQFIMQLAMMGGGY